MILKASNIKKSFDKKEVLKGVNLILTGGTVTLINGKSGEGKTTLGKILSFYIPPDEGEILIDGEKADKKILRKRRIIYLSQNAKGSFDPLYKIGKSLKEALSDKDNESEIYDGLERLSLDRSILSSYPLSLSGGETERLALLRCMLLKPELLILDEIERGLDDESRLKALSYLDEKRGESALLFISHESEKRLLRTDSLYLLEDGVLKSN